MTYDMYTHAHTHTHTYTHTHDVGWWVGRTATVMLATSDHFVLAMRKMVDNALDNENSFGMSLLQYLNLKEINKF